MYRYGFMSLLFICIVSCASVKKGISLYDVHFYDGKIMSAHFSQDTRVKINNIEYVFKKNTFVSFDTFANIETGYLAYDQEIMINKTVFPIKAITINGIGNYNIAFHENGVPRLFWMSKDIKIPVGDKEYVFRGVQTYRPLVLDGPSQPRPVDPLEKIELYDNGNIRSGYIGEAIYVKNLIIPIGTKVVFTRDGRIEKYYDNEQDDYIAVSDEEYSQR
jgi:hypothetical protein